MSLYANFVKECTSWEVVETNHYFFTFNISENTMYVKNLYLIPEKRKTMSIFKLKKVIYSLAKERQVNYISGEFTTENPFNSQWIKFIKNIGWKVIKQATGTTYAFTKITR